MVERRIICGRQCYSYCGNWGPFTKKIIIAFAATAALAGCAKRPDAIVQVDIPMAAYTNLSCEALAAELKKERAKLDDLSKQQISAANGDAFGVFLVGVPIGSVAGGDKEGEIAASKGKVSAMQSAGMSKDCKLPA